MTFASFFDTFYAKYAILGAVGIKNRPTPTVRAAQNNVFKIIRRIRWGYFSASASYPHTSAQPKAWPSSPAAAQPW